MNKEHGKLKEPITLMPGEKATFIFKVEDDPVHKDDPRLIGIDKAIDNSDYSGYYYPALDRATYYTIPDETLAQWRRERLEAKWYRRLWRWLTGLWRNWRGGRRTG